MSLLDQLLSSLKLMVPEFSSIYLEQRDNDPNSEPHKPRSVPSISISTVRAQIKIHAFSNNFTAFH